MKTESCLANRSELVTKTARSTTKMAFGEFIVSFYDSCSEPGAGLMVSLALDAGLVRLQLPGRHHHLPDFKRIEIAAPVRH